MRQDGHGLSGNALAHRLQGLTIAFAQGSHLAFLTLHGLQFLNPVNGFKENELVFWPIPM